MTYSSGWGIPKNSILRRGTLIVGVPKRDDSEDDPMLSGMNALEESQQKQLTEANGGAVPSPQSEATNTPMCSRNSVHEEAGNMDFRIVWNQDGRQSSNYIELLPGEYKGKCWNWESAFIHEAEFEGPLEAIFAKHAPDFDHYGNTAIGKDQCWAIIDDLKALGSSAANELAIWLHGIVAKHGSITVLGV